MQTPPLQLAMPQPPDPKADLASGTKTMAVLAVVFLAFMAFALSFEYKKAPAEKPSAVQTAAAGAADDAFSGLELSAKSAMVFDLTNKEVLYAKNPDAQLPLASLAKIPLAVAVSEALSPDSTITIARDISAAGGERLVKGDKWSLKNVIDFTLVASSNDGAEMLARTADKALRSRYAEAPEGSAALWRMNGIARELGLLRTFFVNISGLDESATLSGAYGSARDMAVLFGYAAQAFPSVFSGTSKDGVVLNSANGRGKTTVYNTNEAAGHVPGLVMGKTGITDLAGGNLAVVFDADPAHRIAAVVLGSTRDGRFSDMKLLVERTRKLVAQTRWDD